MKTQDIHKGDIHLIPFPFTDLSGSKLRPAIIIGTDQQDITVVFITSVLQKDSQSIALPKTSDNGVKIDSHIRYTKLATLDHRTSVGKLGAITKKEYQSLIKHISAFIAL